jgi:hypothetical protein
MAASVAAWSPDSQCQMWLLASPALSGRSTKASAPSPLGVHDDRQRLVVDHDRGHAIGGGVAAGGDDGGDL